MSPYTLPHVWKGIPSPQSTPTRLLAFPSLLFLVTRCKCSSEMAPGDPPEWATFPYVNLCVSQSGKRNKYLDFTHVDNVYWLLMVRITVQERLTCQIAEAVVDAVHPLGVGVVIEATWVMHWLTVVHDHVQLWLSLCAVSLRYRLIDFALLHCCLCLQGQI